MNLTSLKHSASQNPQDNQVGTAVRQGTVGSTSQNPQENAVEATPAEGTMRSNSQNPQDNTVETTVPQRTTGSTSQNPRDKPIEATPAEGTMRSNSQNPQDNTVETTVPQGTTGSNFQNPQDKPVEGTAAVEATATEGAENSNSQNTKDNQVETATREKTLGSNRVGTIIPDVTRIIDDEVLRHRIRAIIDEKPTPSLWKRFSSHALAPVVVGFLLSAIIGGGLTYFYGRLQQEHSFSDELNKIRITKIGGVWEQVDKNELILDVLLEKANKNTGSNKENVDAINKLIDEDLLVINANRFWLGEAAYDQLKSYMNNTGRIAEDMLLGPPGIDLTQALEKRKQAKQDILKMRALFLKGEPEPRN